MASIEAPSRQAPPTCDREPWVLRTLSWDDVPSWPPVADSASGYLAEVTRVEPPGRALVIVGSEAMAAPGWLAGCGWEVTQVCFSNRSLLPLPTAADGRVRREFVDAEGWAPTAGAADLVAILYAHVDGRFLADLMAAGRRALAPAGMLLVAGFDRDNVEWGVGGPRTVTRLYSQFELRELADGMTITRWSQVERETPNGTAIDTVLTARATPVPALAGVG